MSSPVLGSRTDIDGNGGNAKGQAGFLGLYGRRFDGTVIGGHHDSEIERRISTRAADHYRPLAFRLDCCEDGDSPLFTSFVAPPGAFTLGGGV